MAKNIQLTFAMVAIAAVAALRHAQDARQIAQERASAETDVPTFSPRCWSSSRG